MTDQSKDKSQTSTQQTGSESKSPPPAPVCKTHTLKRRVPSAPAKEK